MKRFLILFLLSSPLFAGTLEQDEFHHYFKYNAIGGGVISTSDRHCSSGAISASVGIRGHRAHRFGWDVSLDAMVGIDRDYTPALLLLKGMALAYATPNACRSLYGGVGLAVGGRFCKRYDWHPQGIYRTYQSQAGLFGVLALGYEWLWFAPTRARVKHQEGCTIECVDLPIHTFVQLTIHQPAISSVRYWKDDHPAISLQIGMGY